MATDTLTDEQEVRAKALIEAVREGVAETAGGDEAAVFAMRRYVYIRLQYDERGTPAERKKLKMLKFDEQGGKCPLCPKDVDNRIDKLSGTNLHRIDAVRGYKPDNVQLVHAECHRKQQKFKGYK